MNHNDGFIGNGFFILGGFFHSKRPSKKLVRQYGGSEKGLRLRKEGLPDQDKVDANRAESIININ